MKGAHVQTGPAVNFKVCSHDSKFPPDATCGHKANVRAAIKFPPSLPYKHLYGLHRTTYIMLIHFESLQTLSRLSTRTSQHEPHYLTALQQTKTGMSAVCSCAVFRRSCLDVCSAVYCGVSCFFVWKCRSCAVFVYRRIRSYVS